jgi:hypothetical protein
VHPDLIIDPAQALGVDPQCVAVLGITLVAGGDERVDRVVAAVELDDDQHAAIAARFGRPDRADQERRHGGR